MIEHLKGFLCLAQHELLEVPEIQGYYVPYNALIEVSAVGLYFVARLILGLVYVETCENGDDDQPHLRIIIIIGR